MRISKMLRNYQRDGIAAAVTALSEGRKRFLMQSPTGTGKTLIIIGIYHALRHLNISAIILTPRREIITSFREYGDFPVYTPQKAVNMISAGELDADVILVDEVHHFDRGNTNPQRLMAMLLDTPWIGVSATCYRNQFRQRKAFREFWGEPHILLSERDAVVNGYKSPLEFRIVPILDDDRITLRGGEFVIEETERELKSNFEQLLDFLCADIPKRNCSTMVAVSSRGIAYDIADALRARGISADALVCETKPADRDKILDRLRSAKSVVVQVNVLGEGVNVPEISRIYVLRPTKSILIYTQLIGRAQRNTGERKEIVECTRNLWRHGANLDGIVPIEMVSKSAIAFGELPSRPPTFMGQPLLEKLSNKKPFYFRARSGIGFYYMLRIAATQGEFTVEDKYLLVHTPSGELIKARKRSKLDFQNFGNRKWGKWERVELPDGFEAIPTSTKKRTSPGQQAWWQRSAAAYGLIGDAPSDMRGFEILPICKDLNLRF